MRKSLFLIAALCLTPSASAVAQTPIPGLENFTLERPQPSPTVTPPPPTPSPAPPAAAPYPSPSTATARPAPINPTTRATPQPAAPPEIAIPTDTVTPDANVVETAPTPITTEPTAPPATIAPPADAPIRWPLWAALVAVVMAGLAGFAWWRSRREGKSDEPELPANFIAPAPPARTTDRPAAPVAPTADIPPPARARPGGLITSALKPAVQLGLRPLRGGVDTLRATLEYELQLVNVGRGSARAVAVEAWLLSAGHETAADLQNLFASPAGELMLPLFDLPAAAAIDLAGTATVPRGVLTTITAGERRMFVPVLAVRVRFAEGREAEIVLNAAFLVGIEREGQDRLAPLPLDRGSRMHDRLAARPYDG